MSDIKVQGEFGCAYVRAVAHAAGYVVESAGRFNDEDGIDLTILGLTSKGRARSPRLDVQVKTTASPLVGDPFPIDLEVKNYHQLRDTQAHSAPRVLVVVSVPASRNDWVIATPEQLILKHTGFWRSFRGDPETTNTTSIRVMLKRELVFHPDQLRAIMLRIEEGNPP